MHNTQCHALGISHPIHLMIISFKQIVLLEANKHLGGWVQSKRLDDGTVFELGPRSIRGVGVAGHNTLALVSHQVFGEDFYKFLVQCLRNTDNILR